MQDCYCLSITIRYLRQNSLWGSFQLKETIICAGFARFFYFSIMDGTIYVYDDYQLLIPFYFLEIVSQLHSINLFVSPVKVIQLGE